MKIITIVGARPQFIKAAMVSRAIQRYNQSAPQKKVKEIIVHTGQHFDRAMSEVFFEQLEIPYPDINLDINSCSHGEMTGRMLMELEKIYVEHQPDRVLVYGDTNSTLAGALAAAKLHISVAHVEAGLRSFNNKMPEEINRVLTDHMSDMLFCPTELAVKNLENEGLAQKVYLVGDVMYDSILYYREMAEKQSHILSQLKLEPKNYFLVTLHRAENTDNISNLKSICDALNHLTEEGHTIIVPLHPRTQKKLKDSGIKISGVRFIEPVAYLDMLMLEKSASAILTDSGGMQKEAYWLGVPCITLREETEWTETCDLGWNILVGANTEKILHAVKNIQTGKKGGAVYGDGFAAGKIVDLLTGL